MIVLFEEARPFYAINLNAANLDKFIKIYFIQNFLKNRKS